MPGDHPAQVGHRLRIGHLVHETADEAVSRVECLISVGRLLAEPEDDQGAIAAMTLITVSSAFD